MYSVKKSSKLQNVCYEIRGEVMQEAKRLEEEGQRILKLNIGNPAPFGFNVPEEIQTDVIRNLPLAEGYCDSKGLFSARKAVMHYTQNLGISGVDIEDIYLGNGVSELIVMSMQVLLNPGDEVLMPAPDYPLWSAAVSLNNATAVHYLCNEENSWFPDINDIRSKITPNTRAIVVINPNNPTGSVYSKDCLLDIIQIAREYHLIILSDEIYDKILYDDTQHYSMAALADDLLFLTFNGLSKSYRAAGYRSGWMIISGSKLKAKDFIEGLDILSSMRLCANVPAQFAIQTALGGYQSINDLVLPGGRLFEQRELAWSRLNQIPGVSCVKPQGALYLFPKLDPDVYPIKNDEKLILDLLLSEKILLVQGKAFNIDDNQHFRIVFLPDTETLNDALNRFEQFITHYDQKDL